MRRCQMERRPRGQPVMVVLLQCGMEDIRMGDAVDTLYIQKLSAMKRSKYFRFLYIVKST